MQKTVPPPKKKTLKNQAWLSILDRGSDSSGI